MGNKTKTQTTEKVTNSPEIYQKKVTNYSEIYRKETNSPEIYRKEMTNSTEVYQMCKYVNSFVKEKIATHLMVPTAP